MQRPSQHQSDEIVWNPVGIPLGAVGLDLRKPAAPNSLAKLLNARFRDEKRIERRNGYNGSLVQTGQGFPVGSPLAGDWIYGFGRESGTPIVGQAKSAFRFDDSNVVWTGDRLLVMRDGDTALGGSEFWSRGGGTVETSGIPAYLPVQTDSSAADVVSGDYVETCLTETVRVVIASDSVETLTAWVTDRTTGALLDKTDLFAGAAIRDPRVVNSGGIPVAMWRDGSTLRMSWWSGSEWATPNVVATDCDGHEMQLTATGFVLMWREAGALKIGEYEQDQAVSSDIVFGTSLGLTSTGAFAFAINSNGGDIGVVHQNSGLYATLFDSGGFNGNTNLIDEDVGPWTGGLTVCFRSQSGSPEWVVHAGNGDNYTRIFELELSAIAIQTETRYRTHVASKSFLVGDEVFCWLRARNSETNYLVAGVTRPQVSGFCDREEAPVRVVNDGIKSLPMVTPDPLSTPYKFTWVRPYNTGNSYTHPGNSRIGDIDFMPTLSTVRFGESVYLSGSHVRNYDGIELGDAGFHDYPLITGVSTTAGVGIHAPGTYQFRAYPIRYNRRGERFQGSAITFSHTIGTLIDAMHVAIQTLPCTNHDDVVFEVYRTEAGGTTFYFEGSIANSFTTAFVLFNSVMPDATLRLQEGDPHEAGSVAIDELEEMGPLGCSVLAASADRLWGAGGQVPRGFVQYSKLKEPNEGAGFEATLGLQQVDCEGGEITSLLGHPEATLIFERDKIYVLSGDGPNNYGIGAFSIPQLHVADGAVTHVGTILTPAGPVFWGEDGPRLLLPTFHVVNISAPIKPLTKDMTPSGVQLSIPREEVVWFTEAGDAVLWNLRGSRWAQWTGLQVAGCSQEALVTTDGRLLIESTDAQGDAGVPFAFEGSSGELSDGSFCGDTELNRVGIAGLYEGPHRLRLRIFYNGSPLWSDQMTWDPDDNTWLDTGTNHAAQTPAQIDAEQPDMKSGAYATHKKVNRHNCRHFRVEWSDISSLRPTYMPYELSLEVGSKPGMGRTSVSSFGS